MVKRDMTIKNMVIKGFIIGMFFAIFLTFLEEGLIAIFMNHGYIKPANYLEKNLSKVIDEIQTKGFNKDLLPDGYSYALYDKNTNFIEGNIKKSKLEIVKQNLKIGKNKISDYSGRTQIRIVKNKDKKVALLYTIKVRYRNKYLNKILPQVEILMIIIPFINVSIAFYLVAQKISNNLKSGVDNLIKSANKVAQKDLSFNLFKTSIKEINLLNEAFNNMTDALKDSLKRQWKLEDDRKTQISAIVHDIKTPLMIILGNADLLLETENLSKEQKLYIDSILKGSSQIQSLTHAMLQASSTESKIKINKQKVNMELFIDQIYKQSNSLCKIKGINLEFNVEPKIKQILYFDKQLVERAMLNIINNAVEYTPKTKTIYVSFEFEKEELIFKVKDSGEGFSDKDLIYAKHEFYRGDLSRKRNGHYGLGLYIASNVAKIHKGEIILKNDKNSGAITILSLKNIL